LVRGRCGRIPGTGAQGQRVELRISLLGRLVEEIKAGREQACRELNQEERSDTRSSTVWKAVGVCGIESRDHATK